MKSIQTVSAGLLALSILTGAGLAQAANAQDMRPGQGTAAAMAPGMTMSDPMVGGAAMYPNKTIVENAMQSADHTTLVAAVKAAGLVDTLQGPGPFTVFAPTNEAFAALPSGTVDTLLMPQNKAMLTRILTCHVVAGDISSMTLSKWIDTHNGHYTLTTLGGCKLIATKSNGMIMLTDEKGDVANITIADVNQSNGVIHVVDKVLLPAG